LITVNVKASRCLRDQCDVRAGTDESAWEQIPVDAGSDIAALLQTLGIQPGMTEVILLNKQICRLDNALADGDTVEVYPMACGG
jgi:sulfur carrier protein ThiS